MALGLTDVRIVIIGRLCIEFYLLVVLCGCLLAKIAGLQVEIESVLKTWCVHTAVEVRPQLAMKQSACGIVFHYDFGCVHLSWCSATCLPAFLRGVDLQEGRRCVLVRLHGRQVELVLGFKHFLGDASHQELDRGDVVPHLINRQDTAAHHFSFGVGEGWKH